MGIKNSKEGLFSSYHIMLLVVHFLQAKTVRFYGFTLIYVDFQTPPVLPVLAKTHAHLVGPEIPLDELLELLNKPFDQLIGKLCVIKMLISFVLSHDFSVTCIISDWKSENTRSAAELAIDLIDYYTKFHPFKNAISISKGCSFARFAL
jgi:hypothetical protein